MAKSASKNKQPLVDQLLSFKQLIAQYISFLEVTLHCLLHARLIYPAALFLRRSKYCVAVQRAEHPGVISYIAKVLDLVKVDLEKGAAVRLVWLVVMGEEVLRNRAKGNDEREEVEKDDLGCVGRRSDKTQETRVEVDQASGRKAVERWVFDFDDLLGLGRQGDEWAKTEPVQNGLTTASLEPLFQRLLVQIIGEAGILPLIPPSDDLSFALIVEYSAAPDPNLMSEGYVPAPSTVSTRGIQAMSHNSKDDGDTGQVWIKGVETGVLDMEVVVQRLGGKGGAES